MKKIQFCLIILLLLTQGCGGKTEKNNLLVGKWQKYKEEPMLYSDSNNVLEFNANGWYTSNSNEYYNKSKGSYKVNNGKIYIDSFPIFTIIKLDEMELVISRLTARDYDPDEYYKRKK